MLPGSFCMPFFLFTFYVTYGNIIKYNTNYTKSDRMYVQREGDKPALYSKYSPAFALLSVTGCKINVS